MNAFIRALAILLFVSGTLSAETPSEKIGRIDITPSEQDEIVLAILPFKAGDLFDEHLLSISERLLNATEKFDAEEVTWDASSAAVRVVVKPKAYFEKYLWTGGSVLKTSAIEKICFHPNENRDLTQERLSQINRCLLEEFQNRGYLDAQVSVNPHENDLEIHANLGAEYSVSAIEFEGSSGISNSELLSHLQNKIGQGFRANKIDEDTKSVLRNYLRRGYYLAEILKPVVDVKPETKKVKLTFKITEGHRIEVSFFGDYQNRAPMNRLLEREESLPRYFTDELVDDIVTEMKNDGYLNVYVEVNRRANQFGLELISVITHGGKQFRLVEPDWIGVSRRSEMEHFYKTFEDLKPGNVFHEQDYRKLILDEFVRVLMNNGYLDLRMGSVDFISDETKGTVRPIISLNEGGRYTITKAQVEGLPKGFEGLQEAKDLRRLLRLGKPFDPQQADAQKDDLARALIAQGFLDTKIERKMTKEDEKLAIEYRIDAGVRYKIAKVLIHGAVKTKYTVMKREVSLRAGDFYEQDRVRDAIAEIYRLGIARNVNVEVLEKDAANAKVYVLVNVDEAARFRFEFGPGFGTVDGIRGTIRGTYSNILGTARSLNIYAKVNRKLVSSSVPTGVINPESIPFIERRLNIEYFEPSLFHWHVDGRLAFTHLKENQNVFSLFENAFVASVDYRLSRHWKFTTRYNFEISAPFNIQNMAAVTNSLDPSQKNLSSVGETLLINLLDEDFNPFKGLRTQVDVDVFSKYLGGEKDFWKVLTRQEVFIPIYVKKKGETLGLALAGNVGFSAPYNSTPAITVEKRFFVGGEDSVRGFGEKAINPVYVCDRARGAYCTIQYGGDSFFSFMSEFNIPLAYGIDFLGFLDGGNAYNSDRGFRPWDLRFGAGPGFRWNTPVGPLKIGYGFILGRRIIDNIKEPVGTFYFGVGPI